MILRPLQNIKRSVQHLLAFACVSTGVFVAPPAYAELDRFGLGDGHSGALTITTPQQVVNQYSTIAESIKTGAESIRIGDTMSFSVGDLVLIVSAGAETLTEPLDSSSFSLYRTNIGHYEWARIKSIKADVLTLEAPMVQAFEIEKTQLVKVPEYSTVTIEKSGSIVGTSWDGKQGGIVAFLARKTILNEGTISADGIGFRGGVFKKASSEEGKCTADREAAPQGAQTGESVLNSLLTGRLNSVHSGGGGVCNRSGGGGGGLGGPGGIGGFSKDDNRNIGGLPGAKIVASSANRLLFGGGGGAGQGVGPLGGNGGRGGGIVYIRAFNLDGQGIISANGMSPQDAMGPQVAKNASAGGAGAGGTVVVRLTDSVRCAKITATGGDGGAVADTNSGPGGGGGGGQIWLQSRVQPDVSSDGVAITKCGDNISVKGGAAGLTSDNKNRGAKPGEKGIIESELTGPFCVASSDCPTGSKHLCDVAAGVCGECATTDDCHNTQLPVCSNATCVMCTENQASLCKGVTPACHETLATCGCNIDNDCPNETPVCDAETNRCTIDSSMTGGSSSGGSNSGGTGPSSTSPQKDEGQLKGGGITCSYSLTKDNTPTFIFAALALAVCRKRRSTNARSPLVR